MIARFEYSSLVNISTNVICCTFCGGVCSSDGDSCFCAGNHFNVIWAIAEDDHVVETGVFVLDEAFDAVPFGGIFAASFCECVHEFEFYAFWWIEEHSVFRGEIFWGNHEVADYGGFEGGKGSDAVVTCLSVEVIEEGTEGLSCVEVFVVDGGGELWKM